MTIERSQVIAETSPRRKAHARPLMKARSLFQITAVAVPEISTAVPSHINIYPDEPPELHFMPADRNTSLKSSAMPGKGYLPLPDIRYPFDNRHKSFAVLSQLYIHIKPRFGRLVNILQQPVFQFMKL